MSDQSVYIYVKDKNHSVTQEQKQQAFELFENSITECDFDPYIINKSTHKINHPDGDDESMTIESPFIMTAGNFSATNDFWYLSNDEDEAEESEIDSMTKIRPSMKNKLEEILGSEITITWDFED